MAALARRITRRVVLAWMGGMAAGTVAGIAHGVPPSKRGIYSDTYSNTY